MSLRRIAAAASTFVVAIVLAICVPVSQLRTFSTKVDCCCPDQSHCKCPHEKPDHSNEPKLRACHKTQQDIVAPLAPAFVAPHAELALASEARAHVVSFAHADPHAPPSPRRPDAPS